MGPAFEVIAKGKGRAHPCRRRAGSMLGSTIGGKGRRGAQTENLPPDSFVKIM